MDSRISVAIMNNIEKILKNLKNIRSDSDYTKRSRMLILASKQNLQTPKFNSIFEFLRASTIIAFGLFLLIALIGGAFYINKNFSPLALDGLNQQSLLAEAENMNNSIEMTLGQIKYLDQINQKTLRTITQVTKDQLVTLTPTSSESVSLTPETAQSTSTIESIENYLIEKPSSTDDGGQKIDELLEKISK